MSSQKPRTYLYMGDNLTIKQLAEIKGVSRAYMQVLVNEYGVNDAMAYVRKKTRRKKLYEYKGGKYSADQLADMAAEKCGPQAMSIRIKKHGVEKAVEFDGFEKLRTQAMKGKTGKNNKIDLVEPEPFDKDYELKQRIKSYKKLGWSDDEILIKFRVAA